MKEQMQKKYNRFKKIKIKKRERRKKKKKELNSIELQKPNIEAEGNEKIKNVTEEKKKA